MLVRLAPVDYVDATASPGGSNRPSPREISNTGCAQDRSVPDLSGATDSAWQWGQSVDHDLDLTGIADPVEPLDIAVPLGDPFFDPDFTGTAVIVFNRSHFDRSTGDGPDNPRQQVNQITAFIDASNVYGSDPTRAAALRTNDGTGRLTMSAGDFLPFNTDGLPNAGGPDPSLFLAGDVRANEQVALTAMHIVFAREHNRLARLLGDAHPDLSGDEIYQRVRAIVGALMQVITYQEFLPVLLGPAALEPYDGYRPDVDPEISNAFATVAFRIGHSMLSPVLIRLQKDGDAIEQGHLQLRDAFFTPRRIVDEGGIDPILRGLAAQTMQQIDMLVIDGVRNFLFGEPGAGGFDLASLNMQRGRDHGLPDYNSVRTAFGLTRVASFAEITSDPPSQDGLASLYGSVDNIDAWIGGLVEDHVAGALVGELVYTVLTDQFECLRDGDRLWYERVFSPADVATLERTTLANVIRRNADIDDEIPDNVFLPGT